jgi:hypothetical protein
MDRHTFGTAAAHLRAVLTATIERGWWAGVPHQIGAVCGIGRIGRIGRS